MLKHAIMPPQASRHMRSSILPRTTTEASVVAAEGSHALGLRKSSKGYLPQGRAQGRDEQSYVPTETCNSSWIGVRPLSSTLDWHNECGRRVMTMMARSSWQSITRVKETPRPRQDASVASGALVTATEQS
jgi:hypothetical protein